MTDYDYTYYGKDDFYDNSRISDNLDAAIVQAERETLRQKQVTVRPAHVLIGLLQQRNAAESEAYQVLRDLNVSVPVLIQTLGGSPRRAGARPQEESTRLKLAPTANNAMGLAFEESDRIRKNTVGTGQMLLGLLSEPSHEVADVLAQFGVTEANVRRQVDARAKARALSADGARRSIAPLAPANYSKTPNLDAFSRDVTADVRAGKIDPYIGNHDKLREVLNILGKRTKNNPVLIGEPGVGKTATVEGLAQYMLTHQDELPENLRNLRVVSLDLGSMIAGSRYRGDFEERLKKAIADVLQAKDVLLFIDEFHTVVGAGAAEGAMDASNLLKPLLARGELRVVAATTLEEHRKYIEKDAALERRFRPVYVDEPDVEKTVKILDGVRRTNEKYHNVTITDGALETAARLAERYITTRRQPDKSLDLIDEACSRAIVRRFEVPADLKAMEAKIDALAAQREAASGEQREELRGREEALRTRYFVAREEWESTVRNPNVVIDADDVAEVVAVWTGVPVNKLTESETERLLNMEDRIHERLIGQDAAVTALSDAVRRARSGVKDPKRPAGSYLFLGPTGVGKTELAKALAEFLFDDERALITIDMSTYQEKHTVSRLFGAPPGYVGYEDGGELTEPVRRRPFSVVLLDEIEKAHPDVFDTLLQVMDEGRLTDTKGRVANFKDAFLIMTSNLGVKRESGVNSDLRPIGFAANVARAGQSAADLGAPEAYGQMSERIRGTVAKTFKPEWLNRVDDIIVFGYLNQQELRQVVDLKVQMLDKRLKGTLGVNVQVTKKARDQMAIAGYSPEMGARPLNRLMVEQIETPLSKALLGKDVSKGGTVKIDYSARTKSFTFAVVPVVSKTAAPAPQVERAVA